MCHFLTSESEFLFLLPPQELPPPTHPPTHRRLVCRTTMVNTLGVKHSGSYPFWSFTIPHRFLLFCNSLPMPRRLDSPKCVGSISFGRTVKLAMDGVGRKCLCLFQRVGLLGEDDDECLELVAVPKAVWRNPSPKPLLRLGLSESRNTRSMVDLAFTVSCLRALQVFSTGSLTWSSVSSFPDSTLTS